jgi:hypothetical protein
MARVAAIKTAEQLRLEIQDATGGPQRQAPGFTILIRVPGEVPRVIDPSAPPLIEHQPATEPEYEPAVR